MQLPASNKADEIFKMVLIAYSSSQVGDFQVGSTNCVVALYIS